MFELMVEDSFDAAHALRNYSGPCENLHGHTWKVQVFLQGDQQDEIGILEDFKNIKQALAAVLKEFDHTLLNDLKSFSAENPSSENISKTIFKLIKNKIALVKKVTVWESPSTYAAYWE
jgi:6-pyruvoyltetrahydropterin/6-carboxytetrahydropterin synthase